MRSRLALALAMVVLVLASADSRLMAQQPRRFVFDTGPISLGPNQVARMTAVLTGPQTNSGRVVRGRFSRFGYGQGSCEGDICVQPLAAGFVYEEIQIGLFEAVSLDLANTGSSVRGTFTANSPNVVVTVAIVDTATGMVTSSQALFTNDTIKTANF